ncbi:hypothetical protein AB6A40_001878 [Gnathostoma spinigerum]|uniref:Uncharacterized protein n=1 Tax=Gnathostoma spinigerum TaxID=75299 RepID=A0ABD6ECW6_9BILA
MSRFNMFVVLILSVVSLLTNAEDDQSSLDKRAMRNALVRFGRAGMRNALVRFGKRADYADDQDGVWSEKRSGAAPQPFVRFGRSGRNDHIYDILSTLQRLQMANA